MLRLPNGPMFAVLKACGFALLGFVFLLIADAAHGQLPPGGGNGGGQGNVGNLSGILIDAEGVVRPLLKKGRFEKLNRKRMQAAAAKHLSSDVNRPSQLRKISLPGLEAAYKPFAGKEELIPPDIFYLAGLQRIDYVFVYPERNEIVIAGPAEGFAHNSVGRVVGTTSGRPPLRLDDLVFALRSIKKKQMIGCSIDATAKNMAALQRYVARNSSRSRPSVAASRYKQMSRRLGMQNVQVWGVPADSHFAQTLVEADYRMKRVSMALEPTHIRGFRSHLSMLRAGGNSVQRWWFTPLYDAVFTTDDGNAYQLVGQRAQLMSQEEVTDKTGKRRDAAVTRQSTRKYARHFTSKFPQLAERLPVFAELQNLIDLAILGALLKKENLPAKAGWQMDVFLDETTPTTFPKSHVPRKVASVANYRRVNRGMIIGLIGGGVMIHPSKVLETIEFKTDSNRRLSGIHQQAHPETPTEKNHWWWD